MTVGKTDEIKQELARKVESTKAGTKLKKSMSIADMIKVMEPQIKKALPEVITPERFTRMALSALNTTPKLNECTPMSFLAALMNAAQLGLEPNTPLGQAFLIPYNNKGEMECQFQLGYKGLIDLSYRNPNMQIITAHTVYENDEFEYELGLNPCLNHRPTLGERGEIRLFYGLFKLTNGGFGFEVMSKTAMDDFAKEYSKAFDSSFSPWRTNYESMALKTIIKKALKYAPLKSEFRNALSTDETIKNEIGADMSEINGENIFDTVYQEECASMRRRKKYKLEFLTGIFEEWRFYTISEKMLIRSKEYEKAMKATYELVNKVKSKVSEDAFRDIEEIVNSVCAENNICSRLAYGVGIHDRRREKGNICSM